jgi:hypothetical protein
MPVWSAIFELSHPNRVIIGTDYGIFKTEDITQANASLEWTEENDSMARVPVFMIRQQIYDYPGVNNYRKIYIGTHGKGFFGCDDFYTGIDENTTNNLTNSNNILVYPNPVTNIVNIGYALSQKSNITIKIYDLNGKIVKLVSLMNKPNGYHNEIINCSDLKRGSYIVQLLKGNNSSTSKFIVTK